MSVIDKLPGRTPKVTVGTVPRDVDARVRRGKKAMMKDASKRKVAYRFYRGDQYCWVNEKSQISWSPTITFTSGGGKEPHRVRTTRNMAKGLIEAKVSQATNSTPAYEVNPTSTDPSAASAAKTAQKVAVYGYDKWQLRRKRVEWVTNALVADGGFIMPYFEPNVGPYVPDPDNPDKAVGYGEVKILVLNGSQVAWEPGVDFEDSPWHAIIRARPTSEIQARQGFAGDDLKADASTSDVPTDRPTEEMAVEVEYFERPSPDRPRGRKLVISNDRVIVPEEDYPLLTPDGEVCDEPVLHRLEYTLDPDADRGMGLMDHLIPAQQTLNDCVSKAVEWKNRVLVPQFTAKKGSLARNQIFDDAPGRIYWWTGNPGDEPKPITPPQIPAELFTMADQAMGHMQAIAADPDTMNATSAAPGTLQAIAAQAAQRWTTFLSALADSDAAVMRHCLYLVARFYDEPRQLPFRGHFGWANLDDFKGTDLLGQTEVRVSMTSLRATSRDQVRDEIGWLVQMFPGAIAPEAAMAAINGGIGDTLSQSYMLDVQRAFRIVRCIEEGPQALFSQQPQTRSEMDPATGQMQMVEVPWWMPGPYDNVRIWKQVIGDYLKTDEALHLEPGMRAAAEEIYNGLLMQETNEAARQAQLQNQIAADQGLANAATPQVKALPSQPSPSGIQASNGTPNGAPAGA